MASVVTNPKALQEESHAFIVDKLSKYVPMFSKRTDEGAWDLIGDLESIIEFKLYEKLGFASMEDYSATILKHSSAWCDDLIRIYRDDSKADATIGEVTSKADRNAEIRRLSALGWVQQKIAAEVGCSQMQVSRVLNPKGLEDKNARQFGWMPKSAEKAAKKLHKKFDNFDPGFIEQLKQLL